MFEPKNDKSEWEKIYDELLSKGNDGDVITYQEISNILGRNFLQSRTPIYRARKQLEKSKGHTLRIIRSVGYKILNPNENHLMATWFTKGGKNKISKARHIADNTDITKLAQENRNMIEYQQVCLGRLKLELNKITRKFNKKIENIEVELKNEKKERNKERIDLYRRIEAIEATLFGIKAINQ